MASLTPLSGFPEFLPAEQRAFDALKCRIETTFQSFGYQAMETPAVEKMTTLVAKGAAEQEIYTLRRYQEKSSDKTAELGLRFDLTVPLARYVAQNHSALNFPFRRYQIAPVWRGERPQKGRYRQFYQCDIDIIGENQLSLAHDAEALSVLVQALKELGIDQFHVHLNHKQILLGALEAFGIPEDQYGEFLRLLDKKQKISEQDFISQRDIFLPVQAQALFEQFCSCRGPLLEALASLESLRITTGLFAQGLSQLKELARLLEAFGVVENITLDVSLARGLAYYTGVVFETFIPQAPQLGSIASGGRYDGLTRHFIQRRNYPGIGLSIGLSRLFLYLWESQEALRTMPPVARSLIAVQQAENLPDYIALAQYLRSRSCSVELYLQDKSLGDQFKYASKQGSHFVITANAQELEQKMWSVKDFRTQEQKLCDKETLAQLLSTLRSR